MLKYLVTALLLSASLASNAVSIYPNRIVITGNAGSTATVQYKVYGHPSASSIQFVKSKDLKELDDQVLYSFELGAEQQRVLPITITIPQENIDYYLCAVLSQSQSMRLRVCSAVRIIVSK